MPKLWEYAEIIAKLPQEDQAKIHRIGQRMGAASYNMAIAITEANEAGLLKNTSAVLVLPRSNVVKQAEHGFDHLLRTLQRWQHPGIDNIRQTLISIISQTSIALKRETDYAIAVEQEKLAIKKYQDVSVAVDGKLVKFEVMKNQGLVTSISNFAKSRRSAFQ